MRSFPLLWRSIPAYMRYAGHNVGWRLGDPQRSPAMRKDTPCPPPTASRSSVERHLSLFAATPTDSTAPGRAMAVHEHEPAVGCWEMFPTAVGPARMIPQTDLLGKTTLKARLSWPHLQLPFTRRNVVEEKKETCPRRHL